VFEEEDMINEMTTMTMTMTTTVAAEMAKTKK